MQNAPPLSTGATLPTSNTSLCSIAFNDTIIPYSGYEVSLISSSGNAYPGWPQTWQLNGGPSGTVNISNGAPLWNGTVIYPMPILSQPLNHGPQSISGLVNMTGYSILNVGKVGVGTSVPAYGVDVENDYINTNLGYLFVGGGGTIGQCLVSNGTAFAPGSCGSLPAVYYQHIQSSAALLAQEPFLNFVLPLQAVDNPGSTRTDVSLANSGVGAGSYTNPSITVDALGRVTAAANGTALPKIQALVVTSGFCTTGSSAYASCNSSTSSWPTAFADANYAISCQIAGSITGVTANVFVNSKSASGFIITIQNGTGSGAVASSISEADCVGMHP